MRKGYDHGFCRKLVELGVVTEEQVEEAESISGDTWEDPDDVLVRLRYITPQKHMKHLSSYLGIPFTDLEIEMIDPEAVKLVSYSMAKEFRAIPVSLRDEELTVAVCRPISLEAKDMLSFTTGCNVKTILCDNDDYWKMLRHFYRDEFTKQGSLEEIDGEVLYLDRDLMDREERIEIVEDEIVGLVDGMIAKAIKRRASDIHIEPNESDSRVRMRVDGVLVDAGDYPSTIHEALISRIKILSMLDITERRRPQDGSIFVRYKDLEVDMRIATSPTIYGESVTLRLLDQRKAAVKLDELGFAEEDLGKTLKALREPYGFILSTGPTGCGKTTTMYALLNQLDKDDNKIITIEDPVEYRMDGVCQIPINKRINLGFADLLKSVLRQDPNVILVGEIRDPETAHTAVQAALTGHLMLSTLHTTDAPEVLLRLMEIGIEYYYVREVVKLIIAQRLARRLCPECREPRLATEGELGEMGLSGDVTVYSPRGCDSCGGMGYKGRTGIFEVMPVTHEIKDMMTPGVRLKSLMDIAVEQGMSTLWSNAVRKVVSGETALEEIRRTVPR